MCRFGEMALAADTTSAAAARAWVREMLAAWELADLAADLQLVVSELVTNAVLHARSEVEVTISVGEGIVELAVADTDPRMPQAREAGEVWDEGGRGVTLVSELSSEWGVAHRSHGKEIWVRLPAAGGWPPAASCVCRDPDDGVRHVASGHRVVNMLG